MASDFGPKVKLATLHERISGNGNRYFMGLMGASNVLLFRDPDSDSEQWGEAWSLLVQERPQKLQGAGNSRPRQRRQSMPATKDPAMQRPFDDEIGF